MHMVAVTTNFDGLAIQCIAGATQVGIKFLGYGRVNDSGSMTGGKNNVDVILDEG
jgi:hypothetical protein